MGMIPHGNKIGDTATFRRNKRVQWGKKFLLFVALGFGALHGPNSLLPLCFSTNPLAFGAPSVLLLHRSRSLVCLRTQERHDVGGDGAPRRGLFGSRCARRKQQLGWGARRACARHHCPLFVLTTHTHTHTHVLPSDWDGGGKSAGPFALLFPPPPFPFFFFSKPTVSRTTRIDGYLGSCNDEKRSESRYLRRIAEFRESSSFRTHIALRESGVCLAERPMLNYSHSPHAPARPCLSSTFLAA